MELCEHFYQFVHLPSELNLVFEYSLVFTTAISFLFGIVFGRHVHTSNIVLPFHTLLCNCDGFLKCDRKEFTTTTHAHGHAVENAGARHCFAIVRDDNELGIF